MSRPEGTGEETNKWAPHAIRLAPKLFLVGAICYLSTEIGFAHKVPPSNVSVLWPTNAILFAVLVVTPVRDWWAYAIAAYFTSVIHDARAGFPISGILFLSAALLEAFIAAAGVRRFADGARAFDSLRTLVAYIIAAVVIAPIASSFVAAFAGGVENYWFNWRVWFLPQSLGYLTLAPAILTWISAARTGAIRVSLPRLMEIGLLSCGLLVACYGVFAWAPPFEGSVPALVYLPLPFLLWAAVRFGPPGVSTALLIVTFFSISSIVQGHGLFASGGTADSVIPLQLFLLVISLPLMVLAALIAERHEKTNALSESESRFRTMADTAPVLIWMSGQDRLCTFFNRRWLDFTGRSLEHELGNGWSEGIHSDDVERSLATYVEAFDARQDFAMEYRLRRHDGEYRWILDTGIPRRSADGTFLGYIGCGHDVTERKVAQERAWRQRDELAHVARIASMGELTASLAHELNQPLATILLNAEAAQCLLAAEPDKLDEVQEIVSDIRDMASHAGEVIQRLRAFVRKEHPEMKPVDLPTIIREVVQLTHSDAVLHNCRVSIEATPHLPPVHGDRVQLQQVVLNLLVNAFDAMRSCPTHERHVVVRAEPEGMQMVRVSASDCGTGFEGDSVEKIFQPFYTTKRDGLGMGLSISRAIIEAHGGRLWAKNNPDRGATLYFSVPLGGAREST